MLPIKMEEQENMCEGLPISVFSFFPKEKKKKGVVQSTDHILDLL